ncbi:hypothetical protein GDO78_020776 [Eleutherodactylus coqui]|uniref:Sodefrin-like factor n=1 Tax=Eleutherodactylus coqui TaxID=57060 RepID=A0A8J6E5M1_ELECQ|nr:hypothetical protein GDO78_020776 [Eleutherodactylus coqui]
MTSLVGILSLISALTATSSAISCMQCASVSSTCSGDSITCVDGSVCGSSYTQTFIDVMRIESLIRTCVPLSNCTYNSTVSTKQGIIGVGLSCCSTDDCTPTLPTFPIKSSIPNGVICPSCVSEESAWCYTSDTIQCTGDENICFLQTTEITGFVSTAMRGCATKSYCDLPRLLYNSRSTIKATYTCTSTA